VILEISNYPVDNVLLGVDSYKIIDLLLWIGISIAYLFLCMPSICHAPSYRRYWSISTGYDHVETVKSLSFITSNWNNNLNTLRNN